MLSFVVVADVVIALVALDEVGFAHALPLAIRRRQPWL